MLITIMILSFLCIYLVVKISTMSMRRYEIETENRNLILENDLLRHDIDNEREYLKVKNEKVIELKAELYTIKHQRI